VTVRNASEAAKIVLVGKPSPPPPKKDKELGSSYKAQIGGLLGTWGWGVWEG